MANTVLSAAIQDGIDTFRSPDPLSPGMTKKEIERVMERRAKRIRHIVSGIAAGTFTATQALDRYQGHLDWSSLAPAGLIERFITAGTRGIERSQDEARAVWETLPESLRALGPDELGTALSRYDWSHIVPHSHGGGGEASNGIFELAGLNRARGAAEMTELELAAARDTLSSETFGKVLDELASQALGGALLAGAVSCVRTSLNAGLEYQRGAIARDELFRRIARAAVLSAGTGAAVSGIVASVALTFPAVIPIAAPVMAPLAILAIGVLGGQIGVSVKGWYDLYGKGFKRAHGSIMRDAVMFAGGAVAVALLGTG